MLEVNDLKWDHYEDDCDSKEIRDDDDDDDDCSGGGGGGGASTDESVDAGGHDLLTVKLRGATFSSSSVIEIFLFLGSDVVTAVVVNVEDGVDGINLKEEDGPIDGGS